MQKSPFALEPLFSVGPVPITGVVVTTWVIIGLLGLACARATRRLEREPDNLQVFLELVVSTLSEQIEQVTRQEPRPFLPLLGTLFLFLVVANLSAVLPGVSPPTAHLETPAALAVVVFGAVHFYGIRRQGLVDYLKSFLQPNPLLLPINLISEVTRTFSLMVRLFGNIASHELIIGIVIGLAGLFVPIPLMVLDILIGLVQAYIFAILATVFVGAAVRGERA